jgi:hypothetical protein
MATAGEGVRSLECVLMYVAIPGSAAEESELVVEADDR